MPIPKSLKFLIVAVPISHTIIHFDLPGKLWAAVANLDEFLPKPVKNSTKTEPPSKS